MQFWQLLSYLLYKVSHAISRSVLLVLKMKTAVKRCKISKYYEQNYVKTFL